MSSLSNLDPDPSSSDDDNEDPFRRLHNNPYLTCISDRVDQSLIFPYISDGLLLDDIVNTIVQGTSVLVVGEPGIGKRTLSLGIARRLHEMREGQNNSKNINTSNNDHGNGNGNGNCSGSGSMGTGKWKSVTSRLVYNLSLGREFWSRTEAVSRHVIQNGIRQVFRDVEKAGPEKLVLCIDDLDVLNFIDGLVLKERPLCERDDDEPILSTENMLRFLLFNKKVLCLCTCISAAYQRLVYLDTFYDEKFSKSFRLFHMDEPTLRHSFGIIRAHRPRIEAELDVIITPNAVDAAVASAVTFVTHRRMPEKGLDLIQEACDTAVKLAETEADELRESLHVGGRIIVDKHHVSQTIQKWCGVTQEQLERCYHDERFSL